MFLVPPPFPYPWEVAHRAADAAPDAPWTVLTADAGGLRAARAEAACPPPGVAVHNVVRVAHGPLRDLWLVTTPGRAERLPELTRLSGLPDRTFEWFADFGTDWLRAWAETAAGTRLALLVEAVALPAAFQTSLACDLAERTLGLFPADEPRPRRVWEAAKAWAAAGSNARPLPPALAEAREALVAFRGEFAPADARGHAADALLATTTGTLAVCASLCARVLADGAVDARPSDNWAAAWDAADRASAAILRARVPVGALLAAALDAPLLAEVTAAPV